ncbi:glycosyltransferase family 4 protein [Rhodoplanes sp. Z2-YC6860]|uniref:glycosyltransferase family 4 protein n=1 Tax=Rhodoplanes sp. Z2-YC6860 TaxID=674703 RepID=UPI001F2F0DB5|nr:glycosyltransferase family 4 protein [Rhodoplanes sp. Z2-YC6860]
MLSHPGTGAFVQQTAQALLEADILSGYWTTFADQPDATWRRALVGLTTLFGMDANRELQRRAINEIPSQLLHCAPFWEIIRTLAARLQLDSRLVDLIWERETLRFDSWVAEKALKGVEAIYSYEFSALASFREAKKRGVACIYEVPSPEHEYSEGVIQQEIEKFPELNTRARRYFVNRQTKRTMRRREEWALADLIIVNSEFTRDSYSSAGLDIAKVRVIPLGAPRVEPGTVSNRFTDEKPLKVLWAGTFGVRKGAHHLLAAWRNIASNGRATLDVFGENQLPSHLTDNLPTTIRLSPTVPPSVLHEFYRSADVLVFPTLCDGFGMVVMEAFAHGLPVITTPRAGAAKFVRHGKNGLVIPPGDSVALSRAIEWCIVHRSELLAMRQLALETAQSWQWRDFRAELGRQVSNYLTGAGSAS